MAKTPGVQTLGLALAGGITVALVAVLLFLYLTGDTPAVSGEGGGDPARRDAGGVVEIAAATGGGAPAVDDEELMEEALRLEYAELIERLKQAILAENHQAALDLVKEHPQLLRASLSMLVELLHERGLHARPKLITIDLLRRIPIDKVRRELRRALEELTDLEVRLALVHVLAEIKDYEAVPLLCRILESTSEVYELRIKVADALGIIRDPSATPALLRVLMAMRTSHESNDEKKLVSHVLQALGFIGDEMAAKDLVRILIDPETSPWLQLLLIKALGGIGSDQATGALIALLKAGGEIDPTWGKSMRLESMRALFTAASNGDIEAVRGLVELFDTMEDGGERREALHNLAKVGGEEALDKLKSVLQEGAGQEQQFKDLAVRGLAYRGGPESFDLVLEQLRGSSEYDPDQILQIMGKEFALRATEEQKEAYRAKLTTALMAEENPDLQIAMINTIGLTGDQEMAKSVARLVDTTDNVDVRTKGYHALANANSPAGVPLFERTIKNRDLGSDERYEAIFSLGWYANEEAEQALVRLLDEYTAPEEWALKQAIEGSLTLVRQRLAQNNGGGR